MSGGARGRVRVRFAPDPRARLNVAGARIALVNWLFARHHGGDMILRIEDRDVSRAPEHSFDRLVGNLRWMGLDWDEGPDVGGEFGPYLQSRRIELYRSYLAKLSEGGHLYECYCTPEELAARNREARRQGSAPRYSGRCRTLTLEEQRELKRQGIKPAIRFKGPADGHTPVEDVLRGLMFVDNRRLDDFIVLRRDGVFTYNFCCVVDDLLMEITHVVRGEEHVANTPRQMWLYGALDLAPPSFIHLGRVTEPDGSQLRGGQGGSAVDELRRRGLIPHVLVRFLAGLDGLDAGSGVDLDQLAAQFSVNRLRKGAVIFARKHLYTLNARYLRSLSDEELAGLIRPYLEQAGVWPRRRRGDSWLEDAVGLLRDELVLVSDAVHALTPLLDPSPPADGRRLDQLVETEDVSRVLKAWVEELERAGPVDDWDLRNLAQTIRRRLGVQVRDVFMPLRVALTGRTSGPDLQAIVRLVGREQVIDRLLAAHRQLA